MAVCLPSLLPKSSIECQLNSQPSLPARRGWKSAPGKHKGNRAPCRVLAMPRKLLQATPVSDRHTHTALTLIGCIRTRAGTQTCQQAHINPLRKYLECGYAWPCKRNQPPSSNLHVLSLAICVKHFLADPNPDNRSCQRVKMISDCQVAASA